MGMANGVVMTWDGTASTLLSWRKLQVSDFLSLRRLCVLNAFDPGGGAVSHRCRPDGRPCVVDQ